MSRWYSAGFHLCFLAKTLWIGSKTNEGERREPNAQIV